MGPAVSPQRPPEVRLGTSSPQGNGAVLTLPQAAERYAGMGLRVFPLHGVRGGQCSCSDGKGCPPVRRGKHPRIADFRTRATSDAATVRGWWTKYPDANIDTASRKVIHRPREK